MRKIGLIACAAVLAVAGAAQAQIKAGIPPKPMSQVRAERAAKAEREKLRAAETVQKDADRRAEAPKR